MIRFDKIKRTEGKTYFFFLNSYWRDLKWCLEECGITDFEIVRPGPDHNYEGKIPDGVKIKPVFIKEKMTEPCAFSPVLISNLDIEGLNNAMNEIYKGTDEDLWEHKREVRRVATERWKNSPEGRNFDRDMAIKTYQKLYRIIKEKAPGGTIYEVAQDSGFLSAYEYLENAYVMSDIYAVRQAVRIYFAEQLIRKTINPRFFMERIKETDEEVLSHMETLIPQIFPEHWLSAYKEGTMPVSYQKMVYQSCYIRYYYEAVSRQVLEERYWIENCDTTILECEPLSEGTHAIAKAYDAKAEYALNDGERALVFCLNETEFTAEFAEKRESRLRFLTDTCRMTLKEEWDDADRNLIEKMKDAIDFESLEVVFGIRKEDEKNKKAFADFYASLEEIKRTFIRNDEAVVSFKNPWMEISDTMTREAYRECMIPLYQACTEAVWELQSEYSIDTFSKIYLAGTKCDDISLWEYLEKQYGVEVCILV